MGEREESGNRRRKVICMADLRDGKEVGERRRERKKHENRSRRERCREIGIDIGE